MIDHGWMDANCQTMDDSIVNFTHIHLPSLNDSIVFPTYVIDSSLQANDNAVFTRRLPQWKCESLATLFDWCCRTNPLTCIPISLMNMHRHVYKSNKEAGIILSREALTINHGHF